MLDLFCGGGGATAGVLKYPQFRVIGGVDTAEEAIGTYCERCSYSLHVMHAAFILKRVCIGIAMQRVSAL